MLPRQTDGPILDESARGPNTRKKDWLANLFAVTLTIVFVVNLIFWCCELVDMIVQAFVARNLVNGVSFYWMP